MVTMMKVMNIMSEMVEFGDNTKGISHVENKEVCHTDQGVTGLIIDIQKTSCKEEVVVCMIQVKQKEKIHRIAELLI